MPTVKTALVLQDKMSSVMRSMTKAIGTMITGLEGVETAGGKAFDPNMTRQMRIAVGEANAKLSEMEKSYEDAANVQNKLNKQISQGSSLADGLAGKIKSLVAGYAGMKGIQALANLSDEMAQTEARINLMNDGLQTTDSLMSSIYQSAQRSRGSYTDMAAVVAKFGNNAKDAFSSSQEVVAFSELVQKQMKIAGASGAEASNAMLQLSQALGSGVLRGDELNSIFEQAPNLIQSIADYMKQPIGNIRKLASEGKISADIVKNAMFAASDEINKKFAAMPMTWSDAFTSFKNKAIVALQPVLDQINALANNKDVQSMIGGIASGIAVVSQAAGNLLGIISKVYSFFAENWDLIAPIIGGIAAAYIGLHAAVAVYNTVQAISNGLELLSAAHSAMAAGAKISEAAATTTATGAQIGLNAAMLASPVTWIVLAVVALIAGLIALIAHLGKTTGAAESTFGAFKSGLYIVGAWFKNVFGIIVPALFKATLEATITLAHNIHAAFHNAIAKVQTIFWNLLSTAMEVIAKIAEALNKLPFVKFDASGLTSAANKFAAKAAEAESSTMAYESVKDAFLKAYDKAGGNTAFADGWKKDAAKKGAEKGDALSGKISGLMGGNIGSTLGTIADNTGINGTGGKTADNTGSIAKSLSATNEELSWIRDVAERDVINRFTTAEIKIDMTGMTNEIKNDVDVDGLFNRFTNDVRIALQTAAAGVH